MDEIKQKLVVSLLVCNLIFTIISITGVGYLIYKQVSRGQMMQNFPRFNGSGSWAPQNGNSSNQ